MAIETLGGGGFIATGGHVKVIALVTLKHGLLLEQKCPGMKMSRHMSALKNCKIRMGLSPRKRLTYPKAIEWVEEQIALTNAAANIADTENPN